MSNKESSPQKGEPKEKNVEVYAIICSADENDRAFFRMAEGALVTCTTLPSGLKIPDCYGDTSSCGWYVSKGRVVYRQN